MKLTREVIVSCYDTLRTMQPYRRWNLPPGDQIEWRITTAKTYTGLHCIPGNSARHQISISKLHVVSLPMLIQTLAHEMIHVKQDRGGKATTHGRHFRHCAILVAKALGLELWMI